MRAAISLILLALLFAGCGYKGPLYLPKPKPEAQKPAPKPAPAQDEVKPAADQ
jgi:predicted small lipoprotein YifL